MTWFAELADFMGPAYLRYSFTKGTEQEVAFLVDALALEPGMRVLDVGCGPGRHAHALARRGLDVHGIDISPRFIELARQAGADGDTPRPTFAVGDARQLGFDAEFDAVVSLCQGGFGLVGEDDPAVLRGMARALRPGGKAAFTAFSAYFAVRFIEPGDSFDSERGVNHERTVIRNEDGDEREVDLWTSCFTPRELRLLAGCAGLEVESIWSVGPGAYARREPDLEQPEWLVVARRPEEGENAR